VTRDWQPAHRAAMAACDAADLARRAGLNADAARALDVARRLEREALRRYEGGPTWRAVLVESLRAIKAKRRDAKRRAARAGT
jgi:hypothetical protein